MSTVNRRARGGMIDGEGILVGGAVAVLVVGLGVFVVSEILGEKLVGSHRKVPANPFKLIKALSKHQLSWPVYASEIAALMTVTVVALCGVWFWWWQRTDGHIDRSARHMGRGRTIAPLTKKMSARKSKAFGLTSPGLPIGRSAFGGVPLFMDYESCAVDIWGPRRGKTTSRAVPTILAAPGPVLATSNKRDVADMTRDVREQLNGRVWVFDPQQIAGEPCSWYWNPLSYVRSERHAREMAAIFEACSRPDDAQQDAYFDPQGKTLVANLLLAAASDNRPLTQVYEWASTPTNLEPAKVLEKYGYRLPAKALKATANLSDKQRDGLYGTALKVCAFMEVGDTMEWVEPPSMWRNHPGRVIPPEVCEFDPYAFVQSDSEGTGETLYLLSKEGEGGATPLTSALTFAVCEAAEDIAKRRPRGRLAIPMVVVLDEGANVAAGLERLPDLYSHYGSRGIPLMLILQSYKQGESVWGEKGMAKMWSAANVKVYGGGVEDMHFLSDLKTRVGGVPLTQTSVTTGARQGRSMQHSTNYIDIVSEADLAAMPLGRILVLAGGAKPVLAIPRKWDDVGMFDKKRRQLVDLAQASERAHDPAKNPVADRYVPNSARRS